MDDLARLCEDVGWPVSAGTRAYVVTVPGGTTVNIPRLAPTTQKYDSAYKRLKMHGLETALEQKKVGVKAEKATKIAVDRQQNDGRLAAAEAKAKDATAPAMAVPTVAFSAPDQPAAAISRKREVPAELVGVAGILSLDDDFDFSHIVIKPEDRPKPSKMQETVYELVTPERAFELMLRDVGMLDDGTMLKQRSISPAHVKRYIGILQRDLLEQKKKADGRGQYHAEWVVAEDVKLAPEAPLNTGGVIDGQHRFQGIFDSGIPAIMRITYNTPPTVFLALNQGRKRTDGDIFRMKGLKQTSHMASAAKMLFCWWNWRADPTGPYANWRNWPRMRPTTIQLEAFMADELTDRKTGESLLLPQIKPGSSMMTYIDGVPSAGIAFRVLILDAWKDVNPDLGAAKLEEFCKLLHDGAGPGYKKDHPVHTLREWITRGTGSLAGGDRRERQLNGMLRAWDYFAHSVDFGKILVGPDALMPLPWAPGARSLLDAHTRKSRQK